MRIILALCVLLVSACGRDVTPAALDPANTACASCRMNVSDVHFAAQIVAPGVDPVFFDDLICLRNYLDQPGLQLPNGAVAFVADHRTGEWVRAAEAVFMRPATIETPMRGGFIAHTSEDSRRQDAATAAGNRATVQDVFGPSGPPNGADRK